MEKRKNGIDGKSSVDIANRLNSALERRNASWETPMDCESCSHYSRCRVIDGRLDLGRILHLLDVRIRFAGRTNSRGSSLPDADGQKIQRAVTISPMAAA